MTGSRSAFRNRAEDLGVGAVQALARVLPGSALLAIVGGLSWLAWCLVPGRRRRVESLVSRVLRLPRGDGEVARIARGAYRTVALNAVETGLVSRELRRGANLGKFVSVEGVEHMRAGLAVGPGLIVGTAHIGAWELYALVHKALFGPIWAVGRHVDNPLLQRRILESRRGHLAGILPKDGAALRIAGILRSGEHVGLLLDQNAGRKGVILDFLGLPSSHHNIAGVMAARLGTAVVPAYLLRTERPLRFRLVIEPPITANRSLPAAAAAVDITERLSRSLERQVRAHPDQWVWLHDRWHHAERLVRQADRRAAEDAREVAPSTAGTQWPAAQGTNGG